MERFDRSNRTGRVAQLKSSCEFWCQIILWRFESTWYSIYSMNIFHSLEAGSVAQACSEMGAPSILRPLDLTSANQIASWLFLTFLTFTQRTNQSFQDILEWKQLVSAKWVDVYSLVQKNIKNALFLPCIFWMRAVAARPLNFWYRQWMITII